MDKDENNQFSCEKCQYVTDDKSNYMKHLKTNRHNRTSFSEHRKYVCEPCSFITTSRGNHARHLNTSKHKITIHHITTSKPDGFECHICGKWYSHRPSLSRHLKTCTPVADDHTKVMDLNKERLYHLFCQFVKEHNVMLTNSADST